MSAKKKTQKTEEIIETVTEDVKSLVQEEKTVENINNNKSSKENNQEEQVQEVMTESQIKQKIEQAVKQTKENVEKVKSSVEVEIPLLSKQDRAFVFNLMSKGYQVRDVLSRIKVKLNLSEEVYEKLSKDVITHDDLLKNMGII